MAIALQDYQEVVAPPVIDELRVLAGRVRERRMQHINSTPVGGGVAEILTRMIPLFRELGAGDHGEPIAQVGSYLVPNNPSATAYGNGYTDPNILHNDRYRECSSRWRGFQRA